MRYTSSVHGMEYKKVREERKREREGNLIRVDTQELWNELHSSQRNIKKYKGVDLNLSSACCGSSCFSQKFHREPAGRRAALYVLLVWTWGDSIENECKCEDTVLHHGQDLCYQLTGARESTSSRNIFWIINWMSLFLNHLETHGEIEKKCLCQVKEETIVGGPVTWYLFYICQYQSIHQLVMGVPLESTCLHVNGTPFFFYAQGMCIRPAACNITESIFHSNYST